MTAPIIAFDVVMERSAFAQGTLTIDRLACSVAFLIASGTSRALPAPCPTLPRPSPTTTSAAKPNLLPPYDFSYSVYTNQLLDQFGIFFLFPITSILPICSCHLRFPLKFKTGPACSFSESLYTTVVTISPSIKDNVIESFFESPFCYKFSNRFSC